MNRLRTLLFAIPAAALALAGLGSCMGDDESGRPGSVIPDNAFYNFATYNGSDQNTSSFTVNRDGDAGSATITFARAFDDKQLKAGARVYMAYTTASGQQYVSGPGTLYSLADVSGGEPVEATEANSVRLSTPVKLREMKRTGDYLNIIFEIPVSSSLRAMKLTEAPNPKDPAYPVLGFYIVSDVQEGTFRQARVSFDVDDVLDAEGVKGFKVAYKSDASGLDTLTFNKANTGTITPVE